MEKIIIQKAFKKDLSEILNIQKIVFTEVAIKYNVKNLPQLKQTLEDIENEFIYYVFLKALIRNKIVGSVRAYADKKTCYLNKLIVLPDYQNKGIGTKLMNEIEKQFIDKINRYELFTGSRDTKNRYLYEKLGYTTFKEEKYNDEITFIYMEKRAQNNSK
jgi:ribosomal protein S18 acetylase RimI-like enzyme